MLPGQMSPWQLESVLNVHRNLPLNFHQNRVTTDILLTLSFSGGGVYSHFLVKTNCCVEVGLGF